jgi:hypothetical protein
MACFIVASVECIVAVPVVPYRWLAICRGVSTAQASLIWQFRSSEAGSETFKSTWHSPNSYAIP